MNLKIKYKESLDKFIKKYKKDKNVIGILLTGSFVHSKPDKNSDLDVYIILRKSKTRERGNTWINGVEIEYFINPVRQVEHYLENEDEPHTAHMLANSKVLFKKGNKTDELIKKAKNILNEELEKITDDEKELAKYGLDDLEKDLEDSLVKKNEFSFRQVSIKTLDKCLNIFFKVNRIKFKEKPKRLLEYLKEIDKKFSKLYKKALLEKSMKKKYEKIIELIRYLEGKLGGKRKKEWKLESEVTYNEN